MKDTKKMPPKAENNSSTPDEQAKEASSNTDSQAAHGQPAGSKVIATHGFLKILSTIKRR